LRGFQPTGPPRNARKIGCPSTKNPLLEQAPGQLSAAPEESSRSRIDSANETQPGHLRTPQQAWGASALRQQPPSGGCISNENQRQSNSSFQPCTAAAVPSARRVVNPYQNDSKGFTTRRSCSRHAAPKNQCFAQGRLRPYSAVAVAADREMSRNRLYASASAYTKASCVHGNRLLL
jgi:hypothetical protein